MRRLAEQPEEQWGQAVQLFAADYCQDFPANPTIGRRRKSAFQQRRIGCGQVGRTARCQPAGAGRFIGSSERAKPMVIVVDDAQWSDHESIRTIPKLLAGRGFHGFMVLVESADSVSAVSQLPTASLQATPEFRLPNHRSRAAARVGTQGVGCPVGPAVGQAAERSYSAGFDRAFLWQPLSITGVVQGLSLFCQQPWLFGTRMAPYRCTRKRLATLFSNCPFRPRMSCST